MRPIPADDEDIRVLFWKSLEHAASGRIVSGLTALWLKQNGMKYDTDAYIDHL